MRKFKIGALLLACILFISACSCSKEKFEVTFDSNGGPKIDNVTVSKGERVNKPTDPVREGYIFGGWFIKLDDSNSYDFSKEVTSNLTLIAKWIKVQQLITITLNSNGGSSVSNITLNEGDDVSLPTPVRSGYTFLGWYSGDTKITSTKEIVGNATLVAKWEANQAPASTTPSKPSTPYKPSTQPSTDTPTTPETPADTYACSIEPVAGSVVGQVKVYATKNGSKISGSCTLKFDDGTSKTVSVPASGIDANSNTLVSATYAG